MAYLLDTHTLLWFIAGDKKLSSSVKAIIKNIDQSCYISIASLWELTIKIQLGKLVIKTPLNEIFDFVERNSIEIIPINTEHLLQLSKLPSHHNDPFDRIIVSQAISEDLILLSRDKGFKKYKVKLKW